MDAIGVQNRSAAVSKATVFEKENECLLCEAAILLSTHMTARSLGIATGSESLLSVVNWRGDCRKAAPFLPFLSAGRRTSLLVGIKLSRTERQ